MPKSHYDALGKAARLALLVLLQTSGKILNTHELSVVCGIHRRTAQRDLREVTLVQTRLAKLLQSFNRTALTADVDAQVLARELGIDRSTLYRRAEKRNVGVKIGNARVFKRSDIELLQPKWKRKKG